MTINDRQRPSPSPSLAGRGSRTTALLLAATMCLGLASARADVIGIGDITPSKEDPDNPPEQIPDLPQFGGDVGDDIVVGGTGDNVGGTSAGQMTIDIPSDTDPLISGNGTIGGDAFGFGLVRIVSLNSEWKITDTLRVGNEGQGYLEIIAGARLSTAAGATTGTSAIFDLQVGAVEGSQGFMLIDGFASLALHGNASIGKQGFGQVEVINRGRFETVEGAVVGEEYDLVGDNIVGTGSVLVDGAGSRWNIGIISLSSPDDGIGDLTVGREGRGTIEIQNQGVVRTKRDSIMGEEVDSFGEVIVTGQNSLFWTVRDLIIGELGTARVEIVDRGLVRADRDTIVGLGGLVEMRGGTLLTPEVTNNGVIRGDGRIQSPLVTNEGDIRTAAGVANLRERLWITGALDNNNYIDSIGGEMEVEGLVTNVGQIYGRDAIFRFRGGYDDTGVGELVLENSLVESPVATVANLTIDPDGSSAILGDLVLGGGTLEMTIGDDFSPFVVTGDVDLGGALSIIIGDGYSPEDGDSFTLIDNPGGIISGTFSSPPTFSEPTPGVTWVLDYNPDSVILNAFTGVPPDDGIGADFDNSNLVDGLDLAIWEGNFGQNPATQPDGDADGDGVVDGSDFLKWQLQLGTNPISGVVAIAPVPEPSAIALALAALALPLWRRRR